MRTLITLILYGVTLLGCQNQANVENFELPILDNNLKIEDPLSYVDSVTNSKLTNKTLVELQNGCFVDYITKGQQELENLLSNSKKINEQQTFKLLVEILSRDNYFHLHNYAGQKLAENNQYYLEKDSNGKSKYIKLRMNHSYEDVFKSGGEFYDLDEEKQNGLLRIIKENKETEQTQKYFIEALYSLTAKKENGERVHKEIRKNIQSEVIKNYNDSLYKTFKILKPTFEKLEKIATWMEMDKSKIDIRNLFENSHPIMFLQILSQNPSTVLNSNELSNLKHKALMQILSNTEPNSFYSSYKLIYLNELLLEDNYSVRFLNTIMTKKEKIEFIKQLERS